MGKIIAFVPVRGGSKSIPLKNIKDFCGKPLVYWVLCSLQSSLVDKIIVSTDSIQIESIVKKFGFKKVEIYKRSAKNAVDTATTESAMLEYLSYDSKLKNDDIFILAQATSPLTTVDDFNNALKLYLNKKFDSMLTCVRNKRFFWSLDGKSKNYNYKKRPRRQDFEGELMENGAFYINRVKNILESKNRLSGKIGIYEMPEYSSIEIDEEDDWMIAEKLMSKYVLKDKKQKIKLVAMDVDGVLTDSGMYYSENGIESKKFSTYDGKAVELLRNKKIKTAIITSENTKIVKNRAKKLGVNYVVQGVNNKILELQKIKDIENIKWNEIAYIGDDINDLDILNKVGCKACPRSAMQCVKSISGMKVLKSKGGEGALREFVEIILDNEI